jgi:hypothetical protein
MELQTPNAGIMRKVIAYIEFLVFVSLVISILLFSIFAVASPHIVFGFALITGLFVGARFGLLWQVIPATLTIWIWVVGYLFAGLGLLNNKTWGKWLAITLALLNIVNSLSIAFLMPGGGSVVYTILANVVVITLLFLS